MVKLTNQNLSLKANISSKISNKLTMAYAANYLIYSSQSQKQPSAVSVKTFNHSLSPNIFPVDDLTLRISSEYYYVQQQFTKTNNYLFGDISARYKLKKTRIDAELSCQNLFNTKNFTAINFSNNIEVVSNYQIRPIQLMGKVYFTF